MYTVALRPRLQVVPISDFMSFTLLVPICSDVIAVVIGWIRYCRGYDLDSVPISVQDPLAEALQEAASQ